MLVVGGLKDLHHGLHVQRQKDVTLREVDGRICLCGLRQAHEVLCERIGVVVSMLFCICIYSPDFILSVGLIQPFVQDAAHHALDARSGVTLHQLRYVDQQLRFGGLDIAGHGLRQRQRVHALLGKRRHEGNQVAMRRPCLARALQRKLKGCDGALGRFVP